MIWVGVVLYALIGLVWACRCCRSDALDSDAEMALLATILILFMAALWPLIPLGLALRVLVRRVGH